MNCCFYPDLRSLFLPFGLFDAVHLGMAEISGCVSNLSLLADNRRAQSNLFGGVVYLEMRGYFQWKCHAGSISIPNKIQLPFRPSLSRGCL